MAQLSISELEAALYLQGAPAVLEALNRNLRSYRPITTGGAITAVELELTWVAARGPEDGDGRRRGHSRIRNFLQTIEPIPDCGGASKRRCLRYDIRSLDPRSARFARHLPLRVALCAPRLALRRGS